MASLQNDNRGFQLSSIFSQNCANNDSEAGGRWERNIALGVSGITTSSMLLIIIFLVIFVLRAYKTTLQRLVLYYVIIGLFTELTFALQLSILKENVNHNLCMAVIHLYLYARIACFAYITMMTNCLLFLTLCVMRGKCRFQQNNATIIMEFVCITFAVLAPVTYIWRPLTSKSYEVFCESKTNLTNNSIIICNWHRDAIILNSIVFVMSAEVVTVSFALCVFVCLIRQKLVVRSKPASILFRSSLCHTLINAALMGFNMLFTVFCIYRYHFRHFSKTITKTAYVSIIGVLIPLTLLISITFQFCVSVRMAKKPRMKFKFCNHCCVVDQDVIIDETESKTSPISRPINQPSHTASISAPYTDAFTDITASLRNKCKQGEKKPLLSNVRNY